MRVVFARGLAIVGLLGLTLSAAPARAHEDALLPGDAAVLRMAYEADEADHDIVLARCVPQLDPDAPPPPRKTSGKKVIVIPDASSKNVEKEKVTVRPTPM